MIEKPDFDDFHHIVDMAGRDGYQSVSVDRAVVAKGFLEEMVHEDGRVENMTVADLIYMLEDVVG
ncbi:hypothetical protein AA11826_1688 [Komagataeibacter oboediens DSM 11826]|uniref:Uncharacterized protein n=1 Tax=Komagataeibacter oboediens TaxID=65958 RepID=A0A318QWA3_9PROT|nr:hypothetical protein [Komagataeibacter oboediens]PYD81601.1 hypothetical protein CFR80_10705 [Komagataeibacter oboediens]GBR37525.1 hypothetical protein AA11826_1688 [Komagataeibacter oboediens DSM 11826]